MRKDSYLVETRKFAHVPCGTFFVLFCPDFPAKSSQYCLSIFLPLLPVCGVFVFALRCVHSCPSESSSSYFVAVFGIVVYSSDHTLASGISFPFPNILFREPLGSQL